MRWGARAIGGAQMSNCCVVFVVPRRQSSVQLPKCEVVASCNPTVKSSLQHWSRHACGRRRGPTSSRSVAAVALRQQRLAGAALRPNGQSGGRCRNRGGGWMAMVAGGGGGRRATAAPHNRSEKSQKKISDIQKNAGKKNRIFRKMPKNKIGYSEKC